MSNLVRTLFQKFHEAIIAASSESLPLHGGSDKEIFQFESITDFWRKKDFVEGEYVSISGVISTYAPTMIGSPSSKRGLHLDTRHMLDAFAERQNLSPSGINSLLAFTAGQMVVRTDFKRLPYVYAGLYHSIIRNSIPIFIEKEYFIKEIMPILSNGISAAEVNVVGRFLPIKNSYLKNFIEDFKLDTIYPKDVLEKRLSQQHYALQVNGEADSTSITYIGKARYLDGDIWVALAKDNEDFFISRFIDLSDPIDIENETLLLKRDVEDTYHDYDVLSEYDQRNLIFNKNNILNPEILVAQYLKNTANFPITSSLNEKIKILFFTANPTSSPLRLDKEVKKIKDILLRSSKERDRFIFVQEWATTADSLMQSSLEESPEIIHFSGHGQTDGILIESETGTEKPITGEALAHLFAAIGSVDCVILNACYSESQAHAIAQSVPYVIAMKYSLSDETAIAFSSGFYMGLGAGKSIRDAFEFGIISIGLNSAMDDADIPILLVG